MQTLPMLDQYGVVNASLYEEKVVAFLRCVPYVVMERESETELALTKAVKRRGALPASPRLINHLTNFAYELWRAGYVPKIESNGVTLKVVGEAED